ncbi:MAG TPA: hypothetical protein VHW94_04495 [Candidatus Dormibacteraeota bacterium]|nr:hypothetical protein [Candidatus Dormibacteraeota bacterium]
MIGIRKTSHGRKGFQVDGNPMLGAMVGPQGGASPPQPLAHFSADGFWWWDGAEWKPALSQDGLWRWTGTAWVPAKPAGAGGGGSAVGVTVGLVAAFLGVLVVVAVVVALILYAMGPQITNVFSNVAAALASPK